MRSWPQPWPRRHQLSGLGICFCSGDFLLAGFRPLCLHAFATRRTGPTEVSTAHCSPVTPRSQTRRKGGEAHLVGRWKRRTSLRHHRSAHCSSSQTSWEAERGFQRSCRNLSPNILEFSSQRDKVMGTVLVNMTLTAWFENTAALLNSGSEVRHVPVLFSG